MRRIASEIYRKIRGAARRVSAGTATARTERLLSASPQPPVSGQWNDYILIYAPEAEVEPHLALLSIIGRSLMESGQPVVFARCFEIFKRCPAMDNRKLEYPAVDPARHEVCLKCGTNSLSMLGNYKFPTLDLRAYWTQDIRDTVAAELASLPETLRTYEFDGVGIGKLTAMDLALAKKVSDFDNVSPENRVAWLNYIESTLTSYLLSQELVKQNRFKAVLHYNDYSLLLAARLAARKHGIPGFTVTHAAHNNVDRGQAYIRPGIGLLAWHANREAWPEWRDLPLNPGQIRDVGDDVLSRFRSQGTHQFSPAKTFGGADLRERLGLGEGRKILAAYTSSLDELVASRMNAEGSGAKFESPNQPFEDQIEWLKALVEYAETRPDRALVVRIHPREGFYTRSNMISDHLHRLKENFDRPFENCRFIWPEDKISSYDLAEIADVGLTSWSTIGGELARLGIPVLAGTHGLGSFPIDDFMEWRPTPKEYFEELERQIERPPSLDTLIHAYHWYHLNHLGPSIDLRDVVPHSDFMLQPPYKTPKDADKIRSVVTGEKSLLQINHERLSSAQTPDSPEIEREAVRREIRRIIHFLFTGEDSPDDFKLQIIGSGEEAKPGVRTVAIDGNIITYRHGDVTTSKYSPMIRRLGLLSRP